MLLIQHEKLSQPVKGLLHTFYEGLTRTPPGRCNRRRVHVKQTRLLRRSR